MNQNLHVNKTDFHMKGFALGLALKQRRNATRKSPIRKSHPEHAYKGISQSSVILLTTLIGHNAVEYYHTTTLANQLKNSCYNGMLVPVRTSVDLRRRNKYNNGL